MLPGLGTPADGPDLGDFDVHGTPLMADIGKLVARFGLDPRFLMTLGLILSFFTYSFSTIKTLTRFISANLVSSATVHSSDVTYLYIMRWLAVHRISTDCRLFCVTSRKNPQSNCVRRFPSYPYGDNQHNSDEDDQEMEQETWSEDDDLGPRLKYTPAPGFSYFWYKGRPILINRKLDMSYYTGDIPDETMVLTTIGRSPAFLREFLAEARKAYLQSQSRKTTVYSLSPTPYSSGTWDQGRPRPSRGLSTVIMPQEAKENLLVDVKDYLNPVTMRWYAQRGLPYRRGYLFYGPPGTGKTSLSLALAGELKLPLYILSLSATNLADETLGTLFVGLPRKCVVLLEDIDCAGVYRESDSAKRGDRDSSDDSSDDYSSDEDCSEDSSKKEKDESSSSKGNTNRSRTRSRNSVSFSGLLNAIDGVASHEGRILIMTTNHRERLDSALIRPGRIDVQIELGHADTATLAEIFKEVYKEIGQNAVATVSEEHEKKRNQDTTANDEELNKLSQEFAKKIPANRFTPAEIQGFLISYKGQPEKAMEKIEGWVASRTKNDWKKEARRQRRKERRQVRLNAAKRSNPTKKDDVKLLTGNSSLRRGSSGRLSSSPVPPSPTDFEDIQKDQYEAATVEKTTCLSSTGTRTPDNVLVDLRDMLTRTEGKLGSQNLDPVQVNQAVLNFLQTLQSAVIVQENGDRHGDGEHMSSESSYTTGTGEPRSNRWTDTPSAETTQRQSEIHNI